MDLAYLLLTLRDTNVGMVICALFIGGPLGADDLHRTGRDAAVVKTACQGRDISAVHI
jgi:hypothetical protein